MAMKRKPAKGAPPPKAKHAKAENEVLADAREQAKIEQYWHRAGRTKPRKPPGDYKYVKELAHLQVELIKLQEWVRMQGLKVAVIFEGRGRDRPLRPQLVQPRRRGARDGLLQRSRI